MISLTASAQNVGIGTALPQATLDVKGNHRFGGISKYITYDSISGKIIWNNSNLYVPSSQYIMQHSASAEGLYYNNGQLEYKNQTGNPVFYTNWTNGNAFFSGNVSIGINTPVFPLSFSQNLGDKISLWSNSTNSYGFGIQSSLLQIHTDIAAADITFGYGSSASFTERMRIKGNGNVGIGTSVPSPTLDVAGTARATSITTNNLTVSSGGQPSDFLIKTDVAGTVGFRKGHKGLGLNYIIALQGVYPSQSAPFKGGETYIGEVKLFSGDFAPFGWAICNGQTLPVMGNELLFAVIGTTYGGDGVNNFSLPDMRDRTSVGVGANWYIGEPSN